MCVIIELMLQLFFRKESLFIQKFYLGMIARSRCVNNKEHY